MEDVVERLRDVLGIAEDIRTTRAVSSTAATSSANEQPAVESHVAPRRGGVGSTGRAAGRPRAGSRRARWSPGAPAAPTTRARPTAPRPPAMPITVTANAGATATDAESAQPDDPGERHADDREQQHGRERRPRECDPSHGGEPFETRASAPGRSVKDTEGHPGSCRRGTSGARRARMARLSGERHHPRRRLGHATAPDHPRRLEAAHPGLRQADGLLPAVDADARRHPRHPHHHDPARRASSSSGCSATDRSSA